MPPKNKQDEEHSKLTRIAVVNSDRCKPRKCNLECKKCCPINLQGRLCIEVTNTSIISKISEELCIGCGLCIKKCPYGAIHIINLPTNLEKETVHRYGQNGFKLHRLPLPRPGRVLGLVGANGTGKSTALQILNGKVKPNLGRYRDEPDWPKIMEYFRGSELQLYFKRLNDKKMRVLLKPQYVDQVPKVTKGTVGELLEKANKRGLKDHFMSVLDLHNVADRQLEKLSGGELQRFTIAALCVQDADVYIFDEPSSYLDVRQRITAAKTIRSLLPKHKEDADQSADAQEKYVVVVEHDLSVVDYMSDTVCVLYGRPGVYGVVTTPYGVREGINIFLEGFVPTENLRFREEGLTFHIHDDIEETTKRHAHYQYPYMEKKLGTFNLTVAPGAFSDSEIIVLLGENGCGKTTFIRMLAGHQKPDNNAEVPQLSISYKPQKIAPKFQGTVKDLLQTKIMDAYNHPQFQTDVLKPLTIEELLDQEVQNLSGGQLQRVGICIALGTPANIYLIDEPSAYLDSDQRIIAARVIKRFILHSKRTAFIVEHDFIMATYLADRVIVYEGTPALDCKANAPTSLLDGMNSFLKSLDITFRRDPSNFRPRINKADSVKDRDQKTAGKYFYMNDAVDEIAKKKDKKADKKNEKNEKNDKKADDPSKKKTADVDSESESD